MEKIVQGGNTHALKPYTCGVFAGPAARDATLRRRTRPKVKVLSFTPDTKLWGDHRGEESMIFDLKAEPHKPNLQPQVRKRFSRMIMSAANAGEEGDDEAPGDWFGFGEGGTYTFDSFRGKADDFKRKWFRTWDRDVTPMDVEREYWNVVDGGDLMLR